MDPLLTELKDLFSAVDPVPAAVTAAALNAPMVVRRSGVLGAKFLRRDGAARGVRGCGRLRFRTADCELDIMVDRVRDSVSLRGMSTVPGTTIRACQPVGGGTAVVDESGQFLIDGLRKGPLCLVVQLPTGSLLRTDWWVV
ncbi:hypothetical protein D5S17_13990 [Pseudonocardiaceae bacterium YIM PH 21723]|nr:hypothetical protein D5S17_13990 [Pseudonocardiaceae bacterium YIM PH 21723]